MIVRIEKREKPFSGVFRVGSDKSLTHRAFMLSALSGKRCEVLNPLLSRDCMSTKECLEMCGVSFERTRDGFVISGSIREPEDILDAGNSGTTARILMGLLSGYPIFFVITGDESLRKRPMKRVTAPLSLMGAKILGRSDESFLPVAVRGGELRGIEFRMTVPSAQVKSAILLAGINAEGQTTVVEPMKSRDHTERMLKALGADIEILGNTIRVRPSRLEGFSFDVPGDPSSAAFLVAAAVLVRGSKIEVENVLLNPTRIGFLEVLKRMGAKLEYKVTGQRLGEPVGVIYAEFSPDLRAVEIRGEEIPLVIDEIPLLALVATQANGMTVIKDAAELRVKESDRISATVSELGRMGACITELEDGMIIEGPSRLRGAKVFAHRDHRIAMMLSVAALIAEGETELNGAEWVDVSFPGFFDLILRA